MNEWRDERRWCCFHPREMVVGICALCLNERLLILAASNRSHPQQKRVSLLPKIFALTSLITRSDIKQHNSHDVYDSSQEDSFISIKFEENGVASWDKGKISKMSHDDECDEMSSKKMKTVIEHVKPRAALRWRRRIGHLFQVIKWKRSTSKGNACHVGTKLEGAKVKYGWIRSLTKRRTKE